MNTKKILSSVLPALSLSMLLLLVLGSATFAWFTANRQVGTSRVSARTATEEVQLLLSRTGGEDFLAEDEVELLQKNKARMDRLQPVSTADLQHFICCVATNAEGYTGTFQKVENENYLYHGQFYMMAQVSDSLSDAAVAIYLDEGEAVGGLLVQAEEDSLLLHAARLGLVFDDDPETRVIFSLSEEENEPEQRRSNTRLDGVVLGSDMVLDSSGDQLRAVTDPAVPISRYLVSEEGVLPERPLVTLEPGKICAVDVYFYLEGCDPDCTEALALDGGFLRLAFLGTLC